MSASPKLLTNLNVATMTDAPTPYGLMSDAAIALQDGLIKWVGKAEEIPENLQDAESVDLGGRLVTPGLIDCHTHLVHGGNRAAEFEMRLNGASYEEVARAGGGIISTVRATRSANADELLQSALRRADALIAEGVTTLEIKSGYGLDVDTELRMLRVAREVGNNRAIRVRTSFLGAHAIPADYKDRADAYIDQVCIPTLRQAHDEGLVDAVDGFCEGIAFSTDQIARVFEVARELGLPVKLHAEQLSNLGGAALAARHGALSADHLEYLDEDGVQAMADAGTVAVLLPGAFYTLRETQVPPVQSLREHGVPIALATDANPGSSPLTSLLLAMNMGCTLFRLTPEEALRAVTVHAARAMGLTDVGTIAPGQRAELAVWDVKQPSELAYRIGFNPLHTRIFGALT
ncbi:imidazolonepropionase [Sedimentitalea arenosa]|uniref:Imidazolonepropionase n=1 Tax=Sedimentitalea arenosa TaxID=2798803 RepID=A0A8J7LR90_9RHOB|nr:imidazolonepropionase [Arenibacterium arenosum]MBJ6370599.1 imidazolonepropionase [Arenibacterium arenosum]